MDIEMLLNRTDLREALSTFGIDYEDRAFRMLLKATGVRPVTSERPVRGRPALYEPLSAWVLALFAMKHPRDIARFDNVLETYRVLVDEGRCLSYWAAIPGFDDREFAAQILMCTSSEYGMDPLSMIRLVRSRPDVLDLCSRGDSYLSDVLSVYKDVYAEWLRREQLIPPAYLEQTDAASRSDFSSRWIETFGGRFSPASDEQLDNRPDEPDGWYEADHDPDGPP